MNRFAISLIVAVLVFGTMIVFRGGGDQVMLSHDERDSDILEVESNSAYPRTTAGDMAYPDIMSNENLTNVEKGAQIVVRLTNTYGYDPTVFRSAPYIEDLISAPELAVVIEMYNEFHHVPYNKRIGETSWESVDPEWGTSVKITRGEFERSLESSYASLDDSTLTSLSEGGDVDAALALAKRKTTPRDRLMSYAAAAALAEKTGPLYRALHNDFQVPEVMGGYSSAKTLEILVVRVAGERILKAAGDPRTNPSMWEERMREVAKKVNAQHVQLEEYIAAVREETFDAMRKSLEPLGLEARVAMWGGSDA